MGGSVNKSSMVPKIGQYYLPTLVLISPTHQLSEVYPKSHQSVRTLKNRFIMIHYMQITGHLHEFMRIFFIVIITIPNHQSLQVTVTDSLPACQKSSKPQTECANSTNMSVDRFFELRTSKSGPVAAEKIHHVQG